MPLGTNRICADGFDVAETRNDPVDPVIGQPAQPLPRWVEVPEAERWSRDPSRTFGFADAQDEWGFAPDGTLTAGLRYDDYSDFGGTFHPRLALVWAASAAWTAKRLAGSGFRAPTLFELYAKSSPSAIGNKDLDSGHASGRSKPPSTMHPIRG